MNMHDQYGPMGPLVGAIDAGTSNVKFAIFRARTSDIVASYKIPMTYTSPREGWYEQDPREMLDKVLLCIENTVNKLISDGGRVADVVAVGLANQRETTIVWDRFSGEPLHNAILWSDVRTSSLVGQLINNRLVHRDKDHFKRTTGLPLFNYFSAVKLKWLIDNRQNVRWAVNDKRCCFGTVDSWIMWNLLNKRHVTDVSNASRTMLMNLETLDWDEALLDFFDIPRDVLPVIRSSAEVYGTIRSGSLRGVPISGCLGDQQAALVGQLCLREGDAKATYGTGCFVMFNAGRTPRFSERGLLTTVAYRIGHSEPVYALEGSAAVCGSVFTWFRDNLGIIEDLAEIEKLAANAPEVGSVTFVPAFSGLFSPYWEQDARGVICDVSDDTNTGHIIKGAMEAICFQVQDIVEGARQCGIQLHHLKVDGEAIENTTLMQMQANVVKFSITKAGIVESTALGAALAAQWGIGRGDDTSTFIFKEGMSFHPEETEEDPDEKYHAWKQAIKASQKWCTETDN